MRHICTFILLLLVSFTAFSQNSVSFISETKDEITVRILVYARNEKNAVIEAKLYAINSLLFRGISGSSYSRPIIGTDEERIVNEHLDYFDSFYNSRYLSFITSAIPKSKLVKDETKRKCMVFDVSIKKLTLKRDLEDSGVIRKFGF